MTPGCLHVHEHKDDEAAVHTAQILRAPPRRPSVPSSQPPALRDWERSSAHSKNYRPNSAFQTVIVSVYLMAAFRTSPAKH